MTRDPELLIYSDVDGTLINDAGDNAFAACREAAQTAQVILASSRTVLELARLQEFIGLDGPVLAENGAVVAVRADDPMASMLPGRLGDATILERPWRLGHLAPGIDELHARLRHLSRDDRDIVARALTTAKAGTDREAKARWHSFLLAMPRGSERARLIDAFRDAGLRAEPGGHWIQIVSDADKGQAANALTAAWTACHPRPFTVAIGDESNDISLFAAVDQAYVICRPGDGHHPELLATPGSVGLDALGIAGWEEMLTRLRSADDEPLRAARQA